MLAATYASWSASSRYAVLHSLQTAVKPETRERRLQAALLQEETTAREPKLIDGRDLMAALGLAPGPIGPRKSLADIGATVAQKLGLSVPASGASWLP